MIALAIGCGSSHSSEGSDGAAGNAHVGGAAGSGNTSTGGAGSGDAGDGGGAGAVGDAGRGAAAGGGAGNAPGGMGGGGAAAEAGRAGAGNAGDASMPIRCEIGSLNQGAEGEVCIVGKQCGGTDFGLNCTHDFVNATYRCTCRGPSAPTDELFAKFAVCTDLADEDFLNAACGFHLAGDGTAPDIALVSAPTDPTFPTPPLSSCGDTSVSRESSSCIWSLSCGATALSVACAPPQNTSNTNCTCSIDGSPQQAFAVSGLLSVTDPTCPSEDRAWVGSHCGWPL